MSVALREDTKDTKLGRFRLLPRSENIFLIDKAGWHPAEVAAHNPAIALVSACTDR